MYISYPILLAFASAGAVRSAAVSAPAAADLDVRASSCIFTNAASAIAAKASCPTITLSNIAVPAGKTLDLTGLKANTHVCALPSFPPPLLSFQHRVINIKAIQVVLSGTTTFGYSEWEGPLVSISGTGITVTGAAGSVLDGQGKRWWDGKGSNGRKTQPKVFYAHSLTSSSISGITIKDSPVQVFSINGAKTLTLTGITIDNSAGDGSAGAHNTDAFDVGTSSGVTISGANVKNQDDCLAINSGTVCCNLLRPALLNHNTEI